VVGDSEYKAGFGPASSCVTLADKVPSVNSRASCPEDPAPWAGKTRTAPLERKAGPSARLAQGTRSAVNVGSDAEVVPGRRVRLERRNGVEG